MHLNSIKFSESRKLLSLYDFIFLIIILSILALVIEGAGGMHQALPKLKDLQQDLTLPHLPKYALYTTLRMFAAIIFSLIFTFIVATLAAKNKTAEKIIIPLLDILQSVPILGFLSFTTAFFMGLAPGNELGLELAAVFAVFTSQAWNMTFSFYQSLKNVPNNLLEVSAQLCLTSWQKFWRLEVPFAIPGLVWNTMMSMSGSWFFVVASEVITVNNDQISLPGIGSWINAGIINSDLTAIVWAVMMMGGVIILYDQILFRPIMVWAHKFNMGQTQETEKPSSWFYNMLVLSSISHYASYLLAGFTTKFVCIKWPFSNEGIFFSPKELPVSNQSHLWLKIITY